VTKKRIKTKTMERLVIPFILLMIALFIYLTYHDIVRLIQHVF
jgi:regulator of sigma E protease